MLVAVIKFSRWPKRLDVSVRLALVVSLMLIAGAIGARPANAASWSIQRTPNPTGAQNSLLSAVSCSWPWICTAVGSYYNTSTGTTVTLAEQWNGTKWIIQNTPNPAGATGSSLTGVSCTRTTVCTAVGSYTNGAGTTMALAERWNGTSWSIQTTPSLAGTSGSSFNSVSCTSSAACTAVGEANGVSGGYNVALTLAERWNGVSWTIQSTPNFTSQVSSFLTGVSCPSRSVCAAVGDFGTAPVGPFHARLGAEWWNGASWTAQTTLPNPFPSGDSFTNASCTSSHACEAVGNYFNYLGTPPLTVLAEGWNGAQWVDQMLPNPVVSGSLGASSLNAVSCTRTGCTAVGSFSSGTTFTAVGATLAERWSGLAWVIQSTPNPAGSALNGVSCTWAGSCIAVGEYSNGNTGATLAESYS